MPTNVIMPQMGESIAEGTLTRWMKKIGDSVKRDEPLFEISTDKVDAEIPSPSAGVLLEILVPEGTTVPINTVVAKIGEAGEATATAPAAEAQPQPPRPLPPWPRPPRPSPPPLRPRRPSSWSRLPRPRPPRRPLTSRPRRRKGRRRKTSRSAAPRRSCGTSPRRRASTWRRCPAPAFPGA